MYIIMRVLSACETYIRYNGYYYTIGLQSVIYILLSECAKM